MAGNCCGTCGHKKPNINCYKCRPEHIKRDANALKEAREIIFEYYERFQSIKAWKWLEKYEEVKK
jgi:hypothetical protein